MIGLQQPKNLDDVVFSNRNKSYGAYVLRKKYSRNITIGFMTTVFFLALVLFLYTCDFNQGKHDMTPIEMPHEVTYEVTTDIPEFDLPAPKKTESLPEIIEEPQTNTEDVKVVKNETPIIEKPKTLEEAKPTSQEPSPTPSTEVATGQVNGSGSVETLNPGAGNSGKDIVMRPDIMPEFPGGKTALSMFLQQNVTYPVSARTALTEGQVIVRFIVNSDGSISNIEVYKGIGNGCDEEAIRVIKKMPRWMPGSVKGSPVRVKYNLPINFRLQKK